MRPKRQQVLLSVACAVALVALALVVWSILDPRPMPVVIAMSVAQGLGTLSFLIYLYVVIADLRRARVILHEDDK
jgi:peptidoglycan/LPS O-acetylase OafA/YrhL